MKLSPQHLQQLQARGLTLETVARAGLFTGDADLVKLHLGFGAGTGVCFPYDNPTTYVRVRLDTPFPSPKPGGRETRYLSPAGQPARLYRQAVEDDVLADPMTPLYLTEGEFKALIAGQHGFPTLALPGVWSWKTRLHGRSLDIPDLDRVDWRRRRVIVVFDSDAEQKPPVAWAEHQLCQTLRARGSDVFVIRLPEGPRGEKYGLDDFLVAQGAEAFRRLEMRSVLEGDGGVPTFLRVGDLAEAYLLEARSPHARLKSGIPAIDQVWRGGGPGQVMTLLGRSGVGKTAIALNLVGGLSKEGSVPSLFFSLEMPGTELFERMVSLETGWSGDEVEQRVKLDDADAMQKILETCRRWESVVTVDRPCTLTQLDNLIGQAQKSGMWSQPLRLVVIDYLGLITPEHGGKTYEVVSNLAREVKRLAKRHRVFVVMLCQVSREGENGGKPISMNMARDSGAIEESADYLVGVWRPELDTDMKQEDRAAYKGVLKWRMLKQRGGAACTVELRFETPHLRVSG